MKTNTCFTCASRSLKITMLSAHIIVHGDFCLTSSVNLSIIRANEKRLRAKLKALYYCNSLLLYMPCTTPDFLILYNNSSSSTLSDGCFLKGTVHLLLTSEIHSQSKHCICRALCWHETIQLLTNRNHVIVILFLLLFPRSSVCGLTAFCLCRKLPQNIELAHGHHPNQLHIPLNLCLVSCCSHLCHLRHGHFLLVFGVIQKKDPMVST